MPFISASPDDFDFDNPEPIEVDEVDVPETPDSLHDRYLLKFGDTFNWYAVQKNNDPKQVEQALKLMRSALAGGREAIQDADLDLPELTDTDLNADW